MNEEDPELARSMHQAADTGKVMRERESSQRRGVIYFTCENGHHWSTSASVDVAIVRCPQCTGTVKTISPRR